MNHDILQPDNSLPPKETDVSAESRQLADAVIRLIRQDCEKGWFGDTNPEPVQAPYREIPKMHTIRPERVPEHSARDALGKIVNSLRIAAGADPDTTTGMVRPDWKNRG